MTRPFFIDVQSTDLSDIDKDRLRHPLVGGVILFQRNFVDSKQLKSLCLDIKQTNPKLLIAVDHEGGRVQRFRTDRFTHLPAMGEVRTEDLAYACGAIAAYELKTHGVDINFSPVLDRDNGSDVIKSRGFSADVNALLHLSRAFVRGMQSMGMPACGKHFPGHGSVKADSHIACPVDPRPQNEIFYDIKPFGQLIKEQSLASVMPAHVVYENMDKQPAGYSKYWLQTILRNELGFTGVIFSDDLSMVGASLAGKMIDRAYAAYEAGCDFLLICNAPDKLDIVLSEFSPERLKPSPNLTVFSTGLPKNAESLYSEALQKLQEVSFG